MSDRQPTHSSARFRLEIHLQSLPAGLNAFGILAVRAQFKMDLQIDSIKAGSYAAVVQPYVNGKRTRFEGYKDTLRVTATICVVILITCLLAVTTQAKALSTEDDSFHLKAAIKIVDDID